VTEFPSEDKPPPVNKAETPDVPILSKPRPLHRYRWVLYLFFIGVLALALYVGWIIIKFWRRYIQDVMDT
jgi:hypothetical protein